jgi:DNA-binding XRE family transcriptional regulator
MSSPSRRAVIIGGMDYRGLRRSTFISKTVVRRERKPRVVRFSDGRRRRLFADAIGVTTETVRDWDRGECQPNSRLRRRIHIFALSCGVDRQAELFAAMAAHRDEMAAAALDARIREALARAPRTLVEWRCSKQTLVAKAATVEPDQPNGCQIQIDVSALLQIAWMQQRSKIQIVL